MTVAAQSGSSPTIERTLSRVAAAVGQPQQVVVEAVLLVPHARPVPGLFMAAAIQQKVLDELEDHVLVGAVVAASSTASSSMFWLKSAIQAVPSACSR